MGRVPCQGVSASGIVDIVFTVLGFATIGDAKPCEKAAVISASAREECRKTPRKLCLLTCEVLKLTRVAASAP